MKRDAPYTGHPSLSARVSPARTWTLRLPPAGIALDVYVGQDAAGPFLLDGAHEDGQVVFSLLGDETTVVKDGLCRFVLAPPFPVRRVVISLRTPEGSRALHTVEGWKNLLAWLDRSSPTLGESFEVSLPPEV